MSATASHGSGRKMELQARAINPGMLITPDNGGILLEQDTLKHIANNISTITKRQFTRDEATQLINFIRDMPPQQFYQKTLDFGVRRITNLWLNRVNNDIRSFPRDTGTVDQLAKINEITDRGTVVDYLHQELLQTSDSENQFKWTSHPDRRGNAVIDRDRVNGLRSSPDNIAPNDQDVQVQQLRVMQNVSKSLGSIGQVMNPDNIDHLFKRAQSSTVGLQTFHSITLPHRIIPFDSRNRDVSDTTPNAVKWYLNVSGDIGNLGDIQVQDTLQQIIRIRIEPFYLPVTNVLDDYYTTVDMYIHEFWQRANVTEFLNPLLQSAIQYGYHFRFRARRVGKNRLYLTPEQPEYTFSKPVAQINSITTSFRSPFKPIQLDDDRGVYTATYGAVTLFTLTSGTNNHLSTGDLVYVINFDSPSATINNQMNTESGLIITRINDTQFTVTVDTSSLGVGDLTDITVLYGSKRIFFQIEFFSLEH